MRFLLCMLVWLTLVCFWACFLLYCFAAHCHGFISLFVFVSSLLLYNQMAKYHSFWWGQQFMTNVAHKHCCCRSFLNLVMLKYVSMNFVVTFTGQVNKSLTLNHHSTRYHWPHTLGWGRSDRYLTMNHCHIKFPFSYPQPTTNITYSIVPRTTFIVY